MGNAQRKPPLRWSESLPDVFTAPARGGTYEVSRKMVRVPGGYAPVGPWQVAWLDSFGEDPQWLTKKAPPSAAAGRAVAELAHQHASTRQRPKPRKNSVRRKNFLPAVARGAAFVATSPGLRRAAITGGKYAVAAGKRAVQLALPIAVDIGTRMAQDAIHAARKKYKVRKNGTPRPVFIVIPARGSPQRFDFPSITAAADWAALRVRADGSVVRQLQIAGDKPTVTVKYNAHGWSGDAKSRTFHFEYADVPTRANHHLAPGTSVMYSPPGRKPVPATVRRQAPGTYDNYDLTLADGFPVQGIPGDWLTRRNGTDPVKVRARKIVNELMQSDQDPASAAGLDQWQIENIRSVRVYAFGPGGHGVLWAVDQVHRILTGKRLRKWVTATSHRY